MPKLFPRLIVLLLIPALIADSSTIAPLKTSPSCETRFGEEALASVPTFMTQHMPFTRSAKAVRRAAAKRIKTSGRNSNRRWGVLCAGLAGLFFLLAASPYYKDWVTTWADGSERLTFLSLEIISA